MTDLKLLAGLEPEIPGWVLQNRLREAGYVNIWQKIEGLISAGYIERLKRSWYCLGPLLRKREPSLRYLACNINGPAAVSGSLVLFEAGLIPDAVASVTAVCSRRSGGLDTPYGSIHWQRLPYSLVFPGTYRVTDPPGYIRAAREKALSALATLDELEHAIRSASADDQDLLSMLDCARADLRSAYLPDGDPPSPRMKAPPERGPGKG